MICAVSIFILCRKQLRFNRGCSKCIKRRIEVMKKNMHLLLIALIIVATLTSCNKKSKDPENGTDLFVWDGTVITGLTDKGREVEELIIPDKCTGISNKGYFTNSKFKKLVISDSVTYVDEEAFKRCNSLKEYRRYMVFPVLS